MHWYLLAFLSPLLWAVSNHIDKYILSRYLKNANSGVIAIFAGIVGFFLSLIIFLFSPKDILGIGLINGIIIVLNGALLIIAFIPYYYALNNEDASTVVPLYQTIPIFSFLLGFLILRETVTLTQILAGICIIVGATLISIDLGKTKIALKKRVLFLMLLSSFLISIHFLIFKFVAIEGTFWRTVFWECLGTVLVSAFLLIFIGNYRRKFVSVIKENSMAVILINVFNEVLNIGAKLFANYASLLVPVVLVNLANGLQPMFVFLIGLLLTIFLPFLGREEITKKYIIQRVMAIVILLIGTILLVY